MRTSHRLTSLPVWIVCILLLSSAVAHAQTIALGKPSPDGQGFITADINATVAKLPATTAGCTAPAVPITGDGNYKVRFRASTNHDSIAQGAPQLTGYEMVLAPPTSSQPCYMVTVWSVGPGGRLASPISDPFPLAVPPPAAPSEKPVIQRGTP